MLSEICAAWNAVYQGHAAECHSGSVTIMEPSKGAKNKALTVCCSEAVSFPSRQLEGYDMFSALTKHNCDGVLLVATGEGSYDLVFIEMKSRFSTSEVFDAKCQIVETRIKMKSLLQMLKPYTGITIRRVLGIIETMQLDLDQQDFWLKQQLLPDSELHFGWKLIKYGELTAPTRCKPQLNMPSEMQFKIVLSDSSDYTVNYNNLETI